VDAIEDEKGAVIVFERTSDFIDGAGCVRMIGRMMVERMGMDEAEPPVAAAEGEAAYVDVDDDTDDKDDEDMEEDDDEDDTKTVDFEGEVDLEVGYKSEGDVLAIAFFKEVLVVTSNEGMYSN
jgi:hypothetical protein